MTAIDSIGYPPASTGVRSAASPARNTTSSMSNPHLLLIDDDARLTRMVGDYLRTQGFDVDTAGTLADGCPTATASTSRASCAATPPRAACP
jgi:hypothetical protein